MASREDLSLELVRELFTYDAETGVFTWRARRGGTAISGSIAGHTRKDHYHYLKISGQTHLAHRIAWLYVYGTLPRGCIDHIDGAGTNNAISNLRDATTTENQRNRGKQRNNSSGCKGVYWHKHRSRWAAQITVDGKQRSLGYHKTKTDADNAYRAAAKQYFGEFGFPQ